MIIDSALLILAAGLVLSSIGGNVLLHLIKRNFTDSQDKLTADPVGSIERAIITTLFVLGGNWLYLILPVILVKAGFYIRGLSSLSDIFSRNEPSLAYQKVRVKASLAVDLILSPALAVFIGIALMAAWL